MSFVALLQLKQSQQEVFFFLSQTDSKLFKCHDKKKKKKKVNGPQAHAAVPVLISGHQYITDNTVSTQHSGHCTLGAPESPMKQTQTKYTLRSQSLGTGLSRGHFQTKIATNFINNNLTRTPLSRKRESTECSERNKVP